MYLTFDQYAERWDEIAGVFSREAILKGSFDKYAEAKRGKRGTAEVDEAFLEEIERWRDLLAHTIALRNPALSQRELNFAVQQTIDRIIFLRICEDRGIEPYGTLLALPNGGEIYPRLLLRFRQADARYNSGLFHFQPERRRAANAPERVTPRLAIDDKVLRGHPQEPVLPRQPLRVLGDARRHPGPGLRAVPGQGDPAHGRAPGEGGGEAGGAQGGRGLLHAHVTSWTTSSGRPWASCWRARRCARSRAWPLATGQGASVRIADIACGSGSFLIGAYQFLLDWHLAQYLADDAGGPEKWATGRDPRLYQSGRGEWRLTTGERKRILLDNIYGVDIDPQAVEVTKLSLLLKVLEGEDSRPSASSLPCSTSARCPTWAATSSAATR